MFVTDIRQVSDEIAHNAFTDLIRFKEKYYLAYRTCVGGHMLFTSSRIVIRCSSDGKIWRKLYEAGVPNRDVRDPHFLVLGDTLAVYSGTWLVNQGDSLDTDWKKIESYMATSTDGEHWSALVKVKNTRQRYLWRSGQYQGTYYMCAKCLGQMPNRREAMLVASTDGRQWYDVAPFLSEIGDETAFTFADDGLLTAVVRTNKQHGAYVCRSRPPYIDWQREELSENIGGPLLVNVNSKLLLGGRSTRSGVPLTRFFWLEDNCLEEAFTLPSGGDNSYPGFVEAESGEGLLSYYSSHEGFTAVYLARLIY